MSLVDLVNQAITAGFGEEQILEYIGSKVPNLKEGIRSAKKSGFLPSKILRFLSNSLPSKSRKDNEKQKNINDQYLSGIGLKTRKEREDSRNRALKSTLGVGAGVLGGLALSRGIPAIANSKIGKTILSGIGLNPKSSPSSAGDTSNGSNSQTPLQSQRLPQSPQSSVQQPLATSSNFQTGSGSPQSPLQENLSQTPSPSGTTPKERANAIITKLGIEENINKSNKPGKNLENIINDTIKSLTPEKKAEYQQLSRSGQIPPMAQLIKDYLSNGSVQEQNQPQSGQIPGFQEKISPNGEISDFPIPKEKSEIGNQKSLSEKPQKGSLASTPDGKVGEIKEIRNGHALIESDGKLHKVKEDEILNSPIPEKDLADMWEDVLRGTEKETGEESSRNVYWAGYDPEKNRLIYIPHLGAAYDYEDISPEDAKLLTSVLNVRKSSGENFIGAWKEGTKSPIGAAMSALIKKLQKERGDKGNEYSAKYQPIYSTTETAQRALKKKKKKNEKI